MSVQRKKKPQFSIRERMEMIAVLEELEDLVRSHLDKADRKRQGVASLAGDKAAEEILAFADDVANDPRFERVPATSSLVLAIRSFGHSSVYEGSMNILQAIVELYKLLAGSSWPLQARVRIGLMERSFNMEKRWSHVWATNELKILADPELANDHVQKIVDGFLVKRESLGTSEEDLRKIFGELLKISNAMYTLEAGSEWSE